MQKLFHQPYNCTKIFHQLVIQRIWFSFLNLPPATKQTRPWLKFMRSWLPSFIAPKKNTNVGISRWTSMNNENTIMLRWGCLEPILWIKNYSKCNNRNDHYNHNYDDKYWCYMLECSPSQHQQNVNVHRDPLLKDVILLVILVSSITKIIWWNTEMIWNDHI